MRNAQQARTVSKWFVEGLLVAYQVWIVKMNEMFFFCKMYLKIICTHFHRLSDRRTWFRRCWLNKKRMWIKLNIQRDYESLSMKSAYEAALLTSTELLPFLERDKPEKGKAKILINRLTWVIRLGFIYLPSQIFEEGAQTSLTSCFATAGT